MKNRIGHYFYLLVLCVGAIILSQFLGLGWSTNGPLVFQPKAHYVQVWRHYTEPISKSNKRIILLWTPFFSNLWTNFYETSLNCPFKCMLTRNSEDISRADAVLFNARDLLLNDSLPTHRNPNQVWILHNTEPPYYTYLNMWKYNGVFNWTSFLRKDSDVPCYYGKVIPISEGHQLGLDIPSEWSEKVEFFEEKTKFAYWMASSCPSYNGREKYVEKLRRLMDMDLFGSCGYSSCLRSSGHDHPNCTRVLNQYKFVLALENGDCRNYITEKLWRALERGAIPVVLGGHSLQDYESVAPPHSYIHIKDYSTEKSLVEKLQRISNNKTFYNSFFQWRRNFTIANMYWCDLCSALHNSFQRQVYHDLDGWFRQDSCQPWNLLYGTWIKIKAGIYKLKLFLHLI